MLCLKGLAAILLVGILLFNSVGYRVLNGFMQYRAGRQLMSDLDRSQYDASQLISVKIPATHLSYYNSSTAFERVDGQVEINGVVCQYVERRIYNDSLELLCIPNHTATKLRKAGKNHFRLITDLEQNSDYYIATHILRLKERVFAFLAQRPPFLVHIPSTLLPTDERPPNFQA